MLRRSAALTAALFIAAAPAFAQEGQPKPDAPKETKPAKPAPAVTLKAGDKAPALAIDKWIKGDPITGFEKGHVYVVEFWATWCGPCIKAMPHLSALQKEYKNKGVTIVAVDIAEKYTDGTVAQVEEFVKNQGDNMAFPVAYDGPGKATHNAYMKAAGRNTIPTSFLIDQNGVIAYIGTPDVIELPLAEVVAGTWDLKTGPAKVEQAVKAYQEAADQFEGDVKAGLAAWDKAEKEYPAFAKSRRELKWHALLQAGAYEQADSVAASLVDEAIASRNAMVLNEIAWTIVDPEGNVEKPNLDLAMKAATKADEFTGHKDWMILDTVALVYFLKGDANKALELQQKAFDLAPEGRKAEVSGRLEQFKKAAGKG